MNEESIFSRAIEIPPGIERDQFLEEACDGDPTRRAKIEQLLSHYEQPDSLFARDAGAGFPVATTVERHGNSATNLSEQIGNYRLLHLLGEGGMGSVYLAEQQVPVKRRVAVKVIKQGMNTQQFIARFEAERQALAMMDHPNIAKVLDAGCTDSGCSYFAMELVKGIPITEFCDQNRLTTTERLTLFVQVCQAVQHAHQKGVIHRDLKPSNVMVAMYDDRPVPKVIDFGVAKATHQPLTEQTLYTVPGQIVGTWEYMSPEQAILNQLDVDTRTDIYSLGVILYELITGKTPLDLRSRKTQSLEERLRRIREEEPSRPSLRISSLGQAAGSLATYRNTDSSSLSKSIKGDLDWIVMKALEKDRSRRYETANGFAAEIDRYLNDEPLSFRPPSSWEQFGRFYRRNKPMVTTAAIVVASLTVVLCIMIWANASLRQQSIQLEAQKDAKIATLKDNHRLLIERGLMQALIGETQAVEETLAIAIASGVSESWLLTLRGAAVLHQGDNRIAKARFEKALALDQENTAAKAMLSIALYHRGDVTGWAEHTLDFDDWKVRRQFAELDQLFLAYAKFYIDFEAAYHELGEILEEHKTWIVAYAIYAAAAAESAHESGDLSYVDQSLEKIRVPELVAGDNPFVMMAGLFVRNVAIRQRENVSEALIEESIQLARKLEEYTDYDAGVFMVAGFYDFLSRRDGGAFEWRKKSIAAWERLLENGTGNFRNRAIAELYHEGGYDDRILQIQPVNPEAQLARAFVLAAARDDNAKLDEAMRLYVTIEKKHRSWYLRHRLLQLLLLLGKEQLAENECKKWIEAGDSTGAINRVELREQSIRCVAGMDNTLDLEAERPDQRFEANYLAALRAYAAGNMIAAHQHLAVCQQIPGMGTELLWAQAFQARWPKSPINEN